MVVRVAALKEFFGSASLGALLGIVMGSGSLGGVVGPTLAGWVFDNWGSYQGIWLVFAFVSISALFIILTIPPFDKRPNIAERLVIKNLF